MKAWLADHNAAVMATLFVVFGVKLIADGLPSSGAERDVHFAAVMTP